MDEKRIAEMLATFELDEVKRLEFARFAREGPVSLQPEQPADFRLDCSTLSEKPVEEDELAELA